MPTKSPYLRELGEFLKARRSEVTPTQVGLPEYGAGRRRVDGLRREEMAQLAAISTDYYTRIEQGRLAPSPPVLAAIVRALHLDEEQTDYLEHLVDQAGPRPRRRTHRQGVHPHLQRLLAQLHETPAIVLGPRMDILEWNTLASALLTDFAALAERDRNYIRLVFTDPAMRELFADWEGVARTCVEALRMEAASHPDDPALSELVGDLSIADPQFPGWWAEHRVTNADFGTKTLHHPDVGDLTLDWDTFRYAGAPDQQLVLWTADPDSPSHRRLQQLLTKT